MRLFRKFFKGLNILPKTSTESNEQGDMEVLNSDGKLRYHNGTSNSPVVTEAHSATLTNKTIDADLNTISNIEDADIKAGAAIARDKLASGSANRLVSNDGSGVMADLAAITANRALESDANGLPVASSVTSTELSYVSGVTSSIQTQLNNKADASDLTDHINDTTDAHDASAISNVPAGNLVATDVQGALNELQSDVDSRATSTDLTNHINDTSTHGVTEIVGTSEAQVLTNKDIDGGTASNSRRITIPKDTKANLDALTRKEATLVYASDLDKLYVDNGSALNPVGSGAGGINLVVLDSSLQPNKLDNSDAETSVGDWTAYADAAGSMPVDATGGSPTVTIVRTTTSGQIQNGAASFLVTKDAANRQGEGVSLLVNIPEAYRDTQLTLTLPFETISGSLVEGDIEWFAYDVSNSQVITLQNGKSMLGAYGQVFSLFSVPRNCTQIRLAMHFASTSTTAVTIAFDDVRLEPSRTSVGGITTDWESYPISVTATVTNPVKGTGATETAQWRRVGDSMQILYVYNQTNAGTNAVGDLLYSLPSGYQIDTTKQPVSTSPLYSVGIGKLTDAAGGDGNGFVIAPTAYSTTQLSVAVLSAANTWDNIGGSYANYASANRNMMFLATVPIQGWSSNVTLASSSTYRMSNILANGTRVTTTPTQLGQYRSMRKTGAGGDFVDETPSTSPSAVNGMAINGSTPNGSASAAGLIDLYQIYVGKNKTIQTLFFANTGFTTPIDATIHSVTYSTSLTSLYGALVHYDPLTGVLTVDAGATYGTPINDRALGISTGPGSRVFYNNGYFDVIVSENALAVGVQSPRSEVYVNGGNGHGSIATKIRRFSDIRKNIGSAISYTDSATNGASFTINEAGVYTVLWGDSYSAGTTQLGISVNSSALTTNIANLSYADGFRSRADTFLATNYNTVSWTGNLNVGDIVRPHGNGDADVTSNRAFFSITKVSN